MIVFKNKNGLIYHENPMKNIKKGGDFSMKKVLTIMLSLILAVTFTFMFSCKKAETPEPAKEQTIAPTEPAPVPEEAGTE